MSDITVKFPATTYGNTFHLKKVNAIKAVRAMTGLGLKESKEIMDVVTDGESREIKTTMATYIANRDYLVSSGYVFSVDYTDNDDKLAHRRYFLTNYKRMLNYAVKNGAFDQAREIMDSIERLEYNANRVPAQLEADYADYY